MRLVLFLIIVWLIIASGCVCLTIKPADYRDIRRCNNRIDTQRLNRTEWNKNYEECVIQRYIPF